LSGAIKENSLAFRRFTRWLLPGLAILLAALVAGPWLFQVYWARRSSNPVRRGIARAGELGCTSCHGYLGASGLKDPGGESVEVPAWSGGMSMMYVRNDRDIRHYILEGSVPTLERPASDAAGGPPPKAAIAMPAFRAALSGSDLDDLTAAFKVLAGMVTPKADSPEALGSELARNWQCFSCHGAGGAGGLPNPGSFAGFIPGWYGPDFNDLVRSRGEFDDWIRKGRIARLDANPVAARFMARQRIQMPAYARFTTTDLDQLWAYTRWLERTGGGVRAESNP
jgi:hypothetical protein